MQVALSQTAQSNAIYNEHFSQNNKMMNDPSTDVFTADAPPGTEVIKSNLFRDGSFEEDDGNGGPSEFYDYGSGHSLANYSYQDEVHSGSYGARLSALGTSQYSSDISDSRTFDYFPERAYLDQDITMDFWFNAKANPDIADNGHMMIYLRLTTNLGNYYLYYYLSFQNFPGTNNTQQAYFDLRASEDTWTHVVRNVTDDLVQGVSLLPDLSLSYVRYFYTIANSPINPTGETILLFDDVSFTNSTNFNYFSNNGDFEDGDSLYWYDEGTGPSSCYLTEDDKTKGNRALNLTVFNPYSYTRAYCSAEKGLFHGWSTMPKGYVPHQPGDLIISFDWKYSDMDNGAGEQYAYFYMSFYNTTYSSNLFYRLGDEHDANPNSNYTQPTWSSYNFAADNLGTRDVWNTFTIDLYDLYTALNFTNIPTYYCGFYVEGDNADNLTVQLLVDDFQMVTYPAGDFGFETDYEFNPTDPIGLWTTQSDHNYVNITTDAHSGNFAANVSSYNAQGNRYCYRGGTFLPVTNNLFTDFWWRLDKISPTVAGSAYTYVRLELDDTNLLFYILGSNGMTFMNQSNQCYYNVDEHNQTGSWFNLFRNITEDVAYFGAGTHNITEIYLASFTQGTAEVVTIFDDIHFVTDVTGTILTNLQQNPTAPEYDESATIFVEATDNIALDNIELHYAIDSGSWSSLPMIFNGGEFEATIPAQVYFTLVEYYIEADDVYGHETTLGSELIPYEYVVADTQDPLLDIIAPLESEILAGNVLFDITGEDLGSGLDYFEVRIDGVIDIDNVLPPMQFSWTTDSYENGNHIISFTLIDGAGNDITINYEYEIYNPPTNWEAFTTFMQKWGPYIGGGAGGLAIIVVVLVVVLRRKKGV